MLNGPGKQRFIDFIEDSSKDEDPGAPRCTSAGFGRQLHLQSCVQTHYEGIGDILFADTLLYITNIRYVLICLSSVAMVRRTFKAASCFYNES